MSFALLSSTVLWDLKDLSLEKLCSILYWILWLLTISLSFSFDKFLLSLEIESILDG